jgi:hypothetical protein
MNLMYAVLYINVDDNKSSEIYGVYPTKIMAVNALILAANYREKNGILTQYMRKSIDYDSMSDLYTNVLKDEFLFDTDIYILRKIRKDMFDKSSVNYVEVNHDNKLVSML